MTTILVQVLTNMWLSVILLHASVHPLQQHTSSSRHPNKNMQSHVDIFCLGDDPMMFAAGVDVQTLAKAV